MHKLRCGDMETSSNPVWRTIHTVLVLGILISLSDSAKVLLIPLDHPGHVNVFIISGQALMKYGHEVHLLTNEKFREKIEKAGLTPILYTPAKAMAIADDKEISKGFETVVQEGFFSGAMLSIVPKLTAKIQAQTEEILSDQNLMDRLKQENYGFAVLEGFFPGRPLYAIPYKYDLKYVSIISAIPDAWGVGVPAMPSVEPLAVLPNSDKMSFLDRLSNLLLTIMTNIVIKKMVMEPANFIKRNVPEKPPVTLDELYLQSEMFLNNLEINLMDYPRVSAPHFVYVGGIGGSPANPLQPELEKYVSSSRNGVTVVSFGSMFQKMPLPLLEKLFKVFEKIPQMKFIMRGEADSDIPIPDNTKLVKWLPQNDLLGHPKTKMFVTHGGNNGQTEALYHGVPMVVFPVFGDQAYNAKRVERHGYGKVVSIRQDSVDDIAETFREVLENPDYAKKIKKAAAIKQALPKANETIAFWTDHVIRFGSDHIRPSYIDMPLYKIFMLDVLAFIMILCIIFFFVLYRIIMRLYRMCCKSQTKKEKRS